MIWLGNILLRPTLSLNLNEEGRPGCALECLGIYCRTQIGTYLYTYLGTYLSRYLGI